MAQTRQVRGVATNIYTSNGRTQVFYHGTCVVEFDSMRITLRTGGWRSATTKTRMNQAANQFDLGYHVYQKDHDWYVSRENTVLEFNGDTLTMPRRHDELVQAVIDVRQGKVPS